MNNENAIKPPSSIRIAVGIWVLFGIGYIVVAVLSLFTPSMPITQRIVVSLIMSGFAVIFLYIGFQTIRGRAKDVLGKAIGSIALGFGGFFMEFVDNSSLITLSIPCILALAGILALVGRSQYKAWRNQITSVMAQKLCADSVSLNIKDALEDNLPSLQKSQQAKFTTEREQSEKTFNGDDKVINQADSEQRQIRELSKARNNNFPLLKKAAAICILVGISLPLLGLAFVSNYVPDIDFIWNMQNMEIVLPIDIDIVIDRGEGIPKRLYNMVADSYLAGDTPENIVRKLATTPSYPRIAKETQELIKKGYTADEILLKFARSEIQYPIAISYKYIFSLAVILILTGIGLIIFQRIK